jgi:hypothetical protein
MTEFNQRELANLILEGYTYILYFDMKTHVVLRPLKAPLLDIDVETLSAWQVPIGSEEITHLAHGIPLLDFKVYINKEDPKMN